MNSFNNVSFITVRGLPHSIPFQTFLVATR